jgi:tetratricopeptide (TPR) repeat protein
VLEFEPNNITNHFNVAGLLSELGNYEASNRILYETFDKFEEGQTESHFYLANNYANMDLWDEAELEIVRYLEEDPDGFYLREAEEMMDFMSVEFNRSPQLSQVKSRAQYFAHDQARELLEQGLLDEAIVQLVDIVEQYPSFTAARNNLGLAYFYNGHHEKSLQTILEVLAIEPGNIHAICNLAIVCHHLGLQEQVEELRTSLKKTIPFTDEHLFKLATTLGYLGEHGLAYRHFLRIRKQAKTDVEASLVHFMGVAAFNSGRFEEAGALWKQVLKLDPDAILARRYLDRISAWKAKYGMHAPSETLPYHYHLQFDNEHVKL